LRPKLTPEKVRLIRELHARPYFSLARIGASVGVDGKVIQRIESAGRDKMLNHTKLSRQDVQKVWFLMENYRWNRRRIAEHVGVAMQTVKAVLEYRTWRHVI